MFFHGVPLYHRYAGSEKSLTKDCGECSHFLTGERLSRFRSLVESELGDEVVGVCLWGVAWKRVFPSNKPRKCEHFKLTSPSDHVIELAQLEKDLGIPPVFSKEVSILDSRISGRVS